MAQLDDWHPFQYRDMWDVPRIIACAVSPEYLLVLDCPFDDVIEDYPSFYAAYLLAPLTDEELHARWQVLPELAIWRLPDVPFKEVEFDPTRRKLLRIRSLPALMGARTASASPTYRVVPACGRTPRC